MNYITNERGERVISVGEHGSAARIATIYPDSIKKAIQMCHDRNSPADVLNECRNVTGQFNQYHFLKAVAYYVKLKIVPAV